MTGDQIIAAAQYLFSGTGGSSDVTVSSPMWTQFLTDSVKGALSVLPEEALGRSSLTTRASYALTSGDVQLASTARYLLRVETGSPLSSVQEINPDTVKFIDQNPLLLPLHTVVAYDATNRIVHVRPTTVSSAYLTIHAQFNAITNTTLEVDQVPPEFHHALIELVAGYAYYQEEDSTNGAVFLQMGMAHLGGAAPDVPKGIGSNRQNRSQSGTQPGSASQMMPNVSSGSMGTPASYGAGTMGDNTQ